MKVFMLHTNASKTKIPTIQSNGGQKEAVSDARVTLQQSESLICLTPPPRNKGFAPRHTFLPPGIRECTKKQSILRFKCNSTFLSKFFCNLYQEPANSQHKQWSPATFFRFSLIGVFWPTLLNKEILGGGGLKQLLPKDGNSCRGVMA